MLSETKIKKLLREGTVTSGISDKSGLYLLITKSGYASFHFRYNFNGVQNKFSLGQYPEE
ncbi:Arm DNA-binding domain-containing protein [Pseudoalteromonas sp. 68 DY56-GL68]|uniref:Arm DNA-binding domain-containing protein n=1 Tax=Pseudoalteromonas sp. 68 DY56-GL68 TaxID=2974919 RepID=UPI00352B9DCF